MAPGINSRPSGWASDAWACLASYQLRRGMLKVHLCKVFSRTLIALCLCTAASFGMQTPSLAQAAQVNHLSSSVTRIHTKYTVSDMAVDPELGLGVAISGHTFTDEPRYALVDLKGDFVGATTALDFFPSQIAIDSSLHQAFIAGGGVVDVVDLRTNEMIDSFTISSKAFGRMRIDSSVHRGFYLTTDGTVEMFQTDEHAVIGEPIPVGSASSIDLDPGLHRLVVAAVNAGVPVSMIDTESGAVIASAASDFQVEAGVAVDAILHRAYLTDYFHQTIGVFNLQSGTFLPPIETGASIAFARSVGVDSVNHRLYIGDAGYGALEAVDTKAGSIVPAAVSGVGTNFVTVDPNSHHVWTANIFELDDIQPEMRSMPSLKSGHRPPGVTHRDG